MGVAEVPQTVSENAIPVFEGGTMEAEY